MSTTIELVSSESGEWKVVLINGSVDFAGHTIPEMYWIHLLKYYGFNAKFSTVSDENINRGNYYGEEE